MGIHISRRALVLYVDSCLYFRLEEPHHDLEFLLTLVEYDRWGNIHRYIMEQVHPMEVTKDQGDHSDMSSEEIEEYRVFLR